MSFRQVPSRRQRSFKLRQRKDRTFFEAMEGCAEHERLTVRPTFTYSPLVVAVSFGHLYKGSADQRGIEGLVSKSIVTQLPRQLIAMDPQRLGTPTAAYDLHFQEQFSQQKHELLGCHLFEQLVGSIWTMVILCLVRKNRLGSWLVNNCFVCCLFARQADCMQALVFANIQVATCTIVRVACSFCCGWPSQTLVVSFIASL